MKLLETTINQIRVVDPRWIAAAQARQLELTKPPGSLGRIEEIANRCAAIRETFDLSAGRPRIVLFAADHGVCEENVSPYPQAVTAQMVLNFLRGGAAINAFARAGEIELTIVDVGVASPIDADDTSDGLIRRSVAQGTRNFCKDTAMTETEMYEALNTGIEMANAAADAGCDLLGFGEMGIGNTTSASAITAVLAGQPVESVVGRGTGADDECISRKSAAIERALVRHSNELNSALGILQCVGGFEVAAMTGFCLELAARRVPLLTDGFIATSSAAIAVRLCPPVIDYLFAAHQSPEPGHARLLSLLNLRPLLSLDMRLGEGTGAALAMNLVQASIAAFTQMATFASAGVSNK